MQQLDPQTLELKGRILIEASAGTGKTYTIGHLFLRLLLEQELSVDQILVVTFTQAATEELRNRLRQRIRLALDVLAGLPVDDHLLQNLPATIQHPENAKILLNDALTRMDEAAIFTIHSFCQRMLQEHAFESGAPFSMELLESEQLLRQQIIEDFWRQRFYTASVEEMQWARQFWKTPQELLKKLGGHLNRTDVVCLPSVDEHEVDQLQQSLKQQFQRIQTGWPESGEEITRLLQQSQEKKIISGSKKNYSPERITLAAEELENIAASPSPPWQLSETMKLFTTSNIGDCVLKRAKEPAPEHPFFDLFEQFCLSHNHLSVLRRSAVLLAARKYLQTELTKRKKKRSQLSFDDLLTDLDAALRAANGKILAQAISKRFPVIMVDEFQDTDPLQYRIFSAIHSATPDSGLFLIGDPKQAIYGFRGADIFTYLKARSDTPAAKRLTMPTNYRSATSMVSAVNWMFDRENAFIINPEQLVFSRVKSAGFADESPLAVNNKTHPPLQCLLLPEVEKKSGLSKEVAGEQAAGLCAHEISGLLTAGMKGRAMIGKQPLVAGDIAILVRTHTQANLMRKALVRMQIASVYLSQDSVFAGNEAKQVAILLSAFVDPANNALLRTTLATELFGYTAQEIDDLQHDEAQWEQIIVAMTSYRKTCQRLGFFTMFQQLLSEKHVAGRLLAGPEGERKMTNYLHLADLLQEAGQQFSGTDEMLRWLLDQRDDTDNPGQNRQLRLESDENLIKIVTIHKAKGMEYPVVFLPFLWSARACDKKDPLTFHPTDKPDLLHIDLGTQDAGHYLLAEKERLAEDMRLLYVAFTRAKYCCYFCWGKVNKMQESALCYLLNQPAKLEEDKNHCTDIRNIPHEDELLAIREYIEPSGVQYRPLKLDDSALSPANFTGTIDTNWQITSYSRLISNHSQSAERPDYDQFIEEQHYAQAPNAFGFPKGAAAGTCLHTILEQIHFTDTANHEEVITNQLQYAGFDDSWLAVVKPWMQEILQTELKPGLALQQLQDRDRVNEMSFYFPLRSVNLQRFNQVLKDFSYAPLPDDHGTLQGLMVGFIDLVLHDKGTYYLADYKSNYLGSQPSDYNQEQLHHAMLEHRYDLQYLIYTLALHRFLGQRIKGYSYEQHFGGAFYLFLRGMNPAHTTGTGIFAARPPVELINQLDTCCANVDNVTNFPIKQ